MTLWQKLDMSERIAAVQTTAASKNIEDQSFSAAAPSMFLACATFAISALRSSKL